MRANQIRIIEQKVIKFRQDVGLGGNDAINLKSLLLKLKIVSIFRPLSDDFCGMSLKDKSSHRFMLINSNQSKGRQHFTIAHELYHLYIEEKPKPHKCQLSNGTKNPIEQQADMFASILLMPEDGILQLLSKDEIEKGYVSLASVLRIEHYYSVSRKAILNRLGDLKLLDKAAKDELSKIPVAQSAKEYGYDTSLYQPGNKNLIIADFGEKARTLFDKDKISEGHYIELLNILEYDGHE